MALAFCSGMYLLGNFLYRLDLEGIPELTLETRVVPGQGLVVTGVGSEARAAGVGSGDRILSINGFSTEKNRYHFFRMQRSAQVGEEVILGTETDSGPKKVILQWQEPTSRSSEAALLGISVRSHRFFFNLLLPLALWMIALTLHFSAEDESTEIWASLMILSQTIWFPEEPKLLWPLGLRELGYLFNGVFGPLFFVFALAFFTRFPLPLGAERRLPWLKWALLGALLGLGTVSAVYTLSSIYHFGLYTLTSHFIEWVKSAMQLIWVLCFFFICSSRVRMPERIAAYERSRMGLIWSGIFVGFLPPCLLLFLGLFDPQKGMSAFPSWLQMLAFLFFLAFPLSVAISVIGWQKPVYSDSSGESTP